MPGLEFDQSYGTLLFGARTQLFGLDANLGTSVTVGQKGGNHATVFVRAVEQPASDGGSRPASIVGTARLSRRVVGVRPDPRVATAQARHRLRGVRV